MWLHCWHLHIVDHDSERDVVFPEEVFDGIQTGARHTDINRPFSREAMGPKIQL